mmetsp:Transcript_17903/g.34062  ORF Transcript_17903/g.34062 Transcript_17903/m.34062 type:complete len:269 (+) Transcript_17903:601-1407(+)
MSTTLARSERAWTPSTPASSSRISCRASIMLNVNVCLSFRPMTIVSVTWVVVHSSGTTWRPLASRKTFPSSAVPRSSTRDLRFWRPMSDQELCLYVALSLKSMRRVFLSSASLPPPSHPPSSPEIADDADDDKAREGGAAAGNGEATKKTLPFALAPGASYSFSGWRRFPRNQEPLRQRLGLDRKADRLRVGAPGPSIVPPRQDPHDAASARLRGLAAAAAAAGLRTPTPHDARLMVFCGPPVKEEWTERASSARTSSPCATITNMDI